MACVANTVVLASSSFSIQQSSDPSGTVPTAGPDTVPEDSTRDPSTVSASRFSRLPFGRSKPLAMVKRKVSAGESSEDSPSSLDGGVDYTDRAWTSGSASDWGRFSWAFGLGPSSSSTMGRRRRRRRGGSAIPRGGSSQAGGEEDPMKELLEIVLWNGEREIDFTEELTDDYDSDDDDLECIKRAMAREQTIRPRVPIGGVARVASGGGKKKEDGGGGEAKPVRISSDGLSVSSLRFDSLLKIGSTAESAKKTPITRLEQRTTTMERAFKGVLEEAYISEASKMTSSEVSKTASSSTIVAGGGEEDSENFWNDVEF